MKKNIRFFIFTFILFSVFAPAYAQNDIEISNEISIEGSNKYLLHKVRKGETLYSIARAYNVSVDEIKKANNLKDEKLSVNKTLKIPAKKEDLKNTNIVFDNTTYSFDNYEVKKGETLYKIAEKFDTKLDVILELNPGISNSIREGQVIKVPVKKTVELQEKNKIHIVESGQTLYSIAKQHMLSLNELKKLNPGISSNISVGQKIIVGTETVEMDIVTEANNNIETTQAKPNKLKEYNVALLIPLSAEKTPGKLFTGDDKDKNKYKKITSFSYIEFYEGFKFALDTLVKSGMNINLHVYDLDKSESKIEKVLNSPEMANMNIIFGPFEKERLDTISSFSYEHKIPMVSCFFSGSIELREINPYYFNPVTSAHFQMKSLAEYFAKEKSGANIIIAYQNNDFVPETAKDLHNELTTLGISSALVNISESGLKSVTGKFNSSKENIVVSFINDDMLVSNYTRSLNEYKEKYKITVFALPGWLKNKIVDFEFVENLNTHFFASSFIDYERKDVRDFANKFQKKYKCDPNKQAFLGYDMGIYFLSALHNYGTNFQSFINEHKANTLSTNFEWDKVKGEGERNTCVKIFRMKDLQLWDVNSKTISNK